MSARPGYCEGCSSFILTPAPLKQLHSTMGKAGFNMEKDPHTYILLLVWSQLRHFRGSIYSLCNSPKKTPQKADWKISEADQVNSGWRRFLLFAHFRSRPVHFIIPHCFSNLVFSSLTRSTWLLWRIAHWNFRFFFKNIKENKSSECIAVMLKYRESSDSNVYYYAIRDFP